MSAWLSSGHTLTAVSRSESDLQDFLIAIRSLTDVARHVYAGEPLPLRMNMALYIFLVGASSNFRPWSAATT